jgi:hypothetical protein
MSEKPQSRDFGSTSSNGTAVSMAVLMAWYQPAWGFTKYWVYVLKALHITGAMVQT